MRHHAMRHVPRHIAVCVVATLHENAWGGPPHCLERSRHTHRDVVRNMAHGVVACHVKFDVACRVAHYGAFHHVVVFFVCLHAAPPWNYLGSALLHLVFFFPLPFVFFVLFLTKK